MSENSETVARQRAVRRIVDEKPGAPCRVSLEDAKPPGEEVLLLHHEHHAFDTAGFLLDAELARGPDLPGLVARFFADFRVAYLHAHYARAGCYAARNDRARDPGSMSENGERHRPAGQIMPP